MSEQTVFIKRFPAKGELPGIGDEVMVYYKSDDLFSWSIYLDKRVCAGVMDGGRVGSFGAGFATTRDCKAGYGLIMDVPDYWLEEVALSSLLPEIAMPSREELGKLIFEGVDLPEHPEVIADAIIDRVKKLNPSLFPSTTKTDKT